MDLAFSGDTVEQLREVIRTEMAERFDVLRRFVDRRIAELSMEVSGAVQLMDFSEANILGQLARVHEQIACMIVAPVNATRNSGLELEAVVQTTEAAASRIMEAAEAISEWLHCGSRDAATLRTIDERVSSIFEACSFQDLTGQRIRRAIANLQQVDAMLGGMIDRRAAAMPVPPLAPNMRAVAGPDLGQQEIDRLIGA
jgi:chemotaxis protein CheZ